MPLEEPFPKTEQDCLVALYKVFNKSLFTVELSLLNACTLDESNRHKMVNVNIPCKVTIH